MLKLAIIAFSAIVLGGQPIPTATPTPTNTPTATPTPAGIAFDSVYSAASSASVGSLQIPSVACSGANRLLVVGVAYRRSAGTQDISTVTKGAAGLTQFDTEVVFGAQVVDHWYLIAPSTASETVTITVTGGTARIAAAAVCLVGVHQTAPFDSRAASSGIGTTGSISVSSAVGDLVIDMFMKEHSTEVPSAGGSQTSRAVLCSSDPTSSANACLGMSTRAGTSSVPMEWTWTPTNRDWVHQGVSVNPLTATPPTPTPTPTPTPGGPQYITGGYGSDTAGGDAESTCTVTNTNATGTGSFRTCAHQLSNRKVVFSTSGTITLEQVVKLGSNVTLDFASAPSPGITIGSISGVNTIDVIGQADVKIIGMRAVNCGNDCLHIENSDDVFVTKSSFSTCSDGNLDITGGSQRVTVSYSILRACAKNQLVKYATTASGPDNGFISLHHNIYLLSQSRNPFVSAHSGTSGGCVLGMTDQTLNVDFRFNTVWGWGDTGAGAGFECGARANAIKNMFKCNNAGTCSTSKKNRHLYIATGNTNSTTPEIHASGNDTADSGADDPDTISNHALFAVSGAGVLSDNSETACTAAQNVKALAGARPLSSADQSALNSVTLPSCP